MAGSRKTGLLSRRRKIGAAFGLLVAGLVAAAVCARGVSNALPPNEMSSSRSAYLRTAAAAPVMFQEYDEEAFALARRLDRPILLDIGAIWCHWCHVMDRENYENAEIAGLVNDLFVPVKVDRDLRPDLDARYQAAARAIGGGGGWPLTVILSPHGDPIWAATYVPPERFREILPQVAEWYRRNKERLDADPGALMRAVGDAAARTQAPGAVDDSLVAAVVSAVSSDFDPEEGGFGTGTKFPNEGAVDLALAVGRRTHDTDLVHMAEMTIWKMHHSGTFDQLGGGLHRYGTGRDWRVPHFEKMLYDNAGFIRNAGHLYEATGDAAWRAAAYDAIRWVRETMTETAGGFYATQDADYSMDDDGDYFTWSVPEAKAVLDVGEWSVVERVYDIRATGEMRENPAKNVLFLAEDPAATARHLGIPVAEASRRLASAREKMMYARSRRPTPQVDRTIYTNWNGMVITAYLEAAAAFGDDDLRREALAALDRLLSDAYAPGRGFVRALVVDPSLPGRHVPHGEPGAWLDDQAQMFLALAEAADATDGTGRTRYLAAARDMADTVLPRFRDGAGGYFDLPAVGELPGGGWDPGLGVRFKRVEDSPTPSPNAVAAMAFDRLAASISASDAAAAARYRAEAESTIGAFAGSAGGLGTFASSLGLAAERHLRPSIRRNSGP